MAEVTRILKQKQIGESPTTTQDLAIEVNNLKNELRGLKTHNRSLEERVSKLEIIHRGKQPLIHFDSDN